MSKISKYDPWQGQIPDTAEFVFAYQGKDWKISNFNLSGNINGGGTNITDYIYDIAETPDGQQVVFTLRYNYVPGSTHVYVNGLRLTPRSEYDYQEIGNRQILLVIPPEIDSKIVVDYIATDIPIVTTGIFVRAFQNPFV